MFERFTESARTAVTIAHQEARDLKHNYIGTEHLLLGLLKDEKFLSYKVLKDELGVTYDDVYSEVARIVGTGKEAVVGQIPFTPKAKMAMELALREALSHGHNYVGTEHLLLGLVRQGEGVAPRILLDLDLAPGQIRNAVIHAMMGSKARADIPHPKLRAMAWVAQGSDLLQEIVSLGYLGAVTVYQEAGHPHVRVNVLWDTLSREQINVLLDLGSEYQFISEFSKQYGLTFRPQKPGVMPVRVEAVVIERRAE